MKSVVVNTDIGGGAPLELAWQFPMLDVQKATAADSKVAIAFFPNELKILPGNALQTCIVLNLSSILESIVVQKLPMPRSKR